MTYKPQQGSIAHHVIGHLASIEPGKELSTAEVCKAIGVDHMGLGPFLKKAVEAGVVTVRKREGDQSSYWSMPVEHAPVEDGRPPKTVWAKVPALPEPLRLADLLDRHSHGYTNTPEARAAAQLRRLHKENTRLTDTLETISRMALGNLPQGERP